MTERQHNWTGAVGGQLSHCITCRVPRTEETDAAACEGTCICANCGHHIDEHQFRALPDTDEAPCLHGLCRCRTFKRGVAAWDNQLGWILQKEPSELDTFVADPEPNDTEAPPTPRDPSVKSAPPQPLFTASGSTAGRGLTAPMIDVIAANYRDSLLRKDMEIQELRDRLAKYNALVSSVYARRGGFLDHEHATAKELLDTTTKAKP